MLSMYAYTPSVLHGCREAHAVTATSLQTMPKIVLRHSVTAPCGTDEFRCFNRRCVAKDDVCDDNDTCGDASDEQYIHSRCGGNHKHRYLRKPHCYVRCVYLTSSIWTLTPPYTLRCAHGQCVFVCVCVLAYERRHISIMVNLRLLGLIDARLRVVFLEAHV